MTHFSLVRSTCYEVAQLLIKYKLFQSVWKDEEISKPKLLATRSANGAQITCHVNHDTIQQGLFES